MITFAIPFYSHPQFLQRCVESALAQPNARVLVVDDCSPHRITLDPRVRYVRNEKNLGMAGNWNRCLELADTRYVTILHSDDVLATGYSETVRPLFASRPSAVFCGATIIDADGKEIRTLADTYKQLILPRGEPIVLEGEDGVAALLRGNFITCPTLCYDKNMLGRVRFDASYRFVLDLELVTRLLLEGHRIVGTHRRAYRYRRHGDNATVHLTASDVGFDEERRLWQVLSEASEVRDWKKAAAIGRRQTVLKGRRLMRTLQSLFSR